MTLPPPTTTFIVRNLLSLLVTKNPHPLVPVRVKGCLGCNLLVVVPCACLTHCPTSGNYSYLSFGTWLLCGCSLTSGHVCFIISKLLPDLHLFVRSF